MIRRPLQVLVLLLLASGVALAHPMGNFSINQETKAIIARDHVEIRYFVDMAEIPTYAVFQDFSLTAEPGSAAVQQYVARQSERLKGGLSLSVDGQQLPLRVASARVIFPPGAGGLPTMKLGFVYTAELPGHSAKFHSLSLKNTNYTDRAGWKEVLIVAADTKLIRSSVPLTDRSGELSDYPTDLLNSPPQQTEATAEFTIPASLPPTIVEAHRASLKHPSGAPGVKSAATPAEATAAPVAAPVLAQNKQSTPKSRFTELITSREITGWFLFTALLIAFGLGAFHALEPGHGKTIVGAYLVGSRGSTRDAVLLGSIVTAAHTAGVYLLGVIAIYASRYVVPERLYPWLNLLSGLLICMVAIALFLQARTGQNAAHEHRAGDMHSHWNLFRRNAAPATGAVETPAGPVSFRRLVLLGISGGIVPCPAALVVLLGAAALHRIALGMLLIVAFSAGLAAVLIAIGLLMVHARKLMSRFSTAGSAATKWLPVASASCIFILGTVMSWQALQSMGISFHVPEAAKAPALLGIVGLGLLLGMRHSTDADHVVAVTTIVSRQRSLGGAAAIGALWGVGHTLTIFMVGSAIILFNISIPARLGLAMEFSVALMLVLLGVLNLTGTTSALVSRFTPAFANAGERSSAGWFSATNLSELGSFNLLRPLCVGLVHGLAGSAAVALLVLATIRTPGWAVGYLVIFGLGTVLGMMLMTAAMALPFIFSRNGFTRMNSWLGVTSGLVSFAFGAFLAYQIGFVDGLFTAAPHWTPK